MGYVINNLARKDVEIDYAYVTTYNLHVVATWCNGVIKGMLLPLAEQEIEFHDNGDERRASVGDYIVKTMSGKFFVYSEEDFNRTFDKLK